jgi:phospholipase/carboxylesterase
VLAFAQHRPDEASDGATVAVLLHGRGSHRGDLQALRPHLPHDMVLLTPQAPHPGHPWGYGPGWAWYRYLADDRVDGASLQTSLEALDELLAGLPQALALTPGRILLGGFSQGGTTSLAYALARPGTVHGVLVFSGFLVDDPAVPATPESARGLPVFWGHGTRDPNIPHLLAQRGRARLTAAGADLVAHDYEIGHWIAPEELRDAVAWMEGGMRPTEAA